jgi:hypothetical protein
MATLSKALSMERPRNTIGRCRCSSLGTFRKENPAGSSPSPEEEEGAETRRWKLECLDAGEEAEESAGDS